MDDAASTYHHGDQDITEQARTWKMFGVLTKWFSLHLAVGLLVSVLWFCLGMSFFSGLIPGIVLLVLGIVFLRERPAVDAHH